MRSKLQGNSHLLTLTALGIVFGDIGTSPLYAMREVFHGPHQLVLNPVNLYGVLSLIFWSLIVVVSLKYLQFVLFAHNRGEGGALALMALACMHRKRKIRWGNKLVLSLGLFGAALLVGDGIITPAISVMSAVEGLHVATPVFEPFIMPLTILVLILIFAIQKFGTNLIGIFFGPIMTIWFLTLAALGVHSIVQNPEVLLSLNPMYAVQFFMANKWLGFAALGSVFLVCTGAESLYADLGHFGREPIRNAWYRVAMPGLMLNYLGQGALLLRQPEAVTNPFYNLAPSWATYPMVILATFATIIASQALISGLFSLAKQCVQLGYCPRLNIIHTSSREAGQIYVPPINWFLLIGTIWLVVEFKTSSALASAYGMAVSLTMAITTLLTMVVARIHWRLSYFRLFLLSAIFLAADLAFLGANSLKIADGGWVPLVLAVGVFILMTTWHKGRQVLYQRLRAQSYPFAQLIEDIKRHSPARVPGCAIFMVGDVETTPPPLIHNLKHNKVLHHTVVFLTIVTHELSRVPESEQVEVRKLSDGFYRVIGHYGFMQSPHVTRLLAEASRALPELKIEDPTYFLGREVLIPAAKSDLPFWKSRLFSFLSRNARTAHSYYNLPMDRVIEVGMQVEI